MVSVDNGRYTAVAIVLHWAIAAALLLNLACGIWMHEAIDEEGRAGHAIAVFQLHKSLGLTVLVLSVVRLIWRLIHPVPALPAHVPVWQRRLAGWGHAGLYMLMLALPLSGWLYVSTQWRGDAPLTVPTLWFGLFEVPHLFNLDTLGSATRQSLAALTLDLHELLAWALILLMFGHVAAALKHHLRDRDEILARMVPILDASPSSPARRLVLRVGGLLVAVAILAFGLALLNAGKRSGWGSEPDQQVAAGAGNWLVDARDSYIRFSGEHEGEPFSGRFVRWSAAIDWKPGDEGAAPVVNARIETASARTGVALYDSTLRQTEWFNSREFPAADFAARQWRRHADHWTFDGELSIKNHPVPVKGMRLEIENGVMLIEGRTPIDRRVIDLGMESDPAGDYVSLIIDVEVHVVARPR